MSKYKNFYIRREDPPGNINNKSLVNQAQSAKKEMEQLEKNIIFFKQQRDEFLRKAEEAEDAFRLRVYASSMASYFRLQEQINEYQKFYDESKAIYNKIMKNYF